MGQVLGGPLNCTHDWGKPELPAEHAGQHQACGQPPPPEERGGCLGHCSPCIAEHVAHVADLDLTDLEIDWS